MPHIQYPICQNSKVNNLSNLIFTFLFDKIREIISKTACQIQISNFLRKILSITKCMIGCYSYYCQCDDCRDSFFNHISIIRINFIIRQQFCIMSKTVITSYSHSRSSRITQEITNKKTNSNLTDSTSFFTTKKNTQENIQMDTDITISKTRVSQRDGYSSFKKDFPESMKPFAYQEKSRFRVFKNLQQFEVQMKSQHGKLQKFHPSLNSFGIGTFKGTRTSMNSHHICVHVGSPSSFALIEGYDGYYAANQLKKRFNQELISNFRKQKTNQRQEIFKHAENCIKKTIQNIKKYLQISQQNIGDNSGASFLAIIAYNSILFAANCGSSEAFCVTKTGKLFKFAKSHTTSNPEEVNRIIKQGGKLYQTSVNIPYKKQMIIKGPLRVYPTGLTLTRTIGKSLSKQKKRHKTVSDSFENRKGVISELQISYIPMEEVRWLAILSSKVVQNVKQLRIKDIIEQELSKKSGIYLQQKAAQHACKRIILQAAQAGATESLSSLVIFSNIQDTIQKQTKTNLSKLPIKIENSLSYTGQEKLARQPRSLKYIGNRVNFVEIQ